MKVGILGGTFDPLHRAHLTIAEEAYNKLKLGVVLFVPAGQPWMKAGSSITAVEHRVAMVRLAIADKPYFRLSTIEVERSGLTYTVDTLVELNKQAGGKDELFFILGAGSLEELPRWREPLQIIALCKLVVAPRPGYIQPPLEALEAQIQGLSQRVILLDSPLMDISATVIREYMAKGLSISQLVPDKVEGYIKEHGLYLSKEDKA